MADQMSWNLEKKKLAPSEQRRMFLDVRLKSDIATRFAGKREPGRRSR